MAAAAKTDEFVNDVEAGDYQSFATDESGAAAQVAEGDNGKPDQEEDMIELDTVGADAEEGEKMDTSASAAPKFAKGDAENDEHDLVAMPSKVHIMNDLGEFNRKKRLIVRPLSPDDLLNPILHDVIRSKSCSSVSLDFVSCSDDEHSKVGIMTVMFTTSKQTAQAMATLQTMREDLNIECVESTVAAVEKWKKENSSSGNKAIGPMLIVKNLDPATASVEKLADIFPDAEDIVISAQPQASNLGKLKGTKNAYLIYADEDQASIALQAFHANPVLMDDREIIVSSYKEPPNHIPEGYLVLTTRKLVLRQIARAKGLMVRCQEDPTYEMAAVWPERLKRATEMIEKDDEARDALGLPKPTLLEFKDMSNLRQLTQAQSDQVLSKLQLSDAPSGGGGSGNQSNRKRLSAGGGDVGNNKRQNRGGGRGGRGGQQQYNQSGGRGGGGRGGGGRGGFQSQSQGRAPLMGAPANAGMMFGMMQPRLPRLISPQSMYTSLTPGPGNFPMQSRMLGGGLRNPSRGGGRGYGRPY